MKSFFAVDAIYKRCRLASATVAMGIALPIVFVVAAWLYGGGIPYFKDSNESFLSYVHAKNLVVYNPASFSFLTAEDTSLTGVRPRAIYTHNPNFPRYVNYGLLNLGISSLPLQVLLITTTATALAMFFMWRIFQARFPRLEGVWIVVPLAFILDFMGFLQFVVNSYRVFAFVLFWGCLLAITRNVRTLAVCGAFFLLFQFEYTFAIFLFVTCLTYVVCFGSRDRVKRVVAAALGAIASVGLFGIQLISFYGLQGLMTDVRITYIRRNFRPGVAMPADVREFVSRYNVFLSSQSPYVPLREMLGTGWIYLTQFYNAWVVYMLLWGIGSSVVLSLAMARRGQGNDSRPDLEVRLYVSRVILSMTVGMLCLVVFLRGYFVAAYIRSFLPLLVFPIAFSIAATGLDLYTCLHVVVGRVAPGIAAYTRGIAYVVALMPLIVNVPAKVHAYQPLRGDFVKILSTRLASEKFVAPINFHNLAFALTGGPALPSPRVPSAESLPSDWERVYYLCIERPWMGTDCPGAMAELLKRGAELSYRGSDYVILKLR